MTITYRTPTEIVAAYNAQCKATLLHNDPAIAVTVYDPADLMVAWSLDPEGTVVALARLSAQQLSQQALAHALFLERLGRTVAPRTVWERWTNLIVEEAA